MEDNFNQKAQALKALSDTNRLLIIDFLKDGERCACKILEQLNITQPTLSHHMKILGDSDLVNCRRDGKWIHYSLNRDKFRELEDFLGKLSEYAEDNCNCNCK
jgi:ArsR family transcriptional regulator